jgi:pilus assembly protein CpaB
VTARRRRGVLLLAVALTCGGVAASRIHQRERALSERVGPPVEVLVAARDLPAGARMTRGALGVRRVPARFVPPDALASAAGLVGARTAARVAAGGYLTAGLFVRANGGLRGDGGVGRGQRAVTVGVTGSGGVGADSAAGLVPGARVDVLVSTESAAAGGRTVMALAGAELLRLEPGAGATQPDPGLDPDGSATLTALATLRVSVRQAIYLTAADNFAREIRLLARPPGDRSSAGASVSQGQL